MDSAESIYFIHTGKITLFVEVTAYIKDDEILKMIQMVSNHNNNGEPNNGLDKENGN